MSSSTAIPVSSGVGIDRDDTDLARATMRRVSLRLLPFLFLIYIFNFLDRTNVAIAALQMNRDLHFSATAYGFGAGIFSLGYALFEVPSTLVLARVGARLWISRIMITWGLVAAAMMFVHTPIQFYSLRFLLGVAEAGFVSWDHLLPERVVPRTAARASPVSLPDRHSDFRGNR